MDIFSRLDEKSMHYGEIFSAWTYLLALKGWLGAYSIFLNHIEDPDLKGFIKEFIKKSLKTEIKELDDLFSNNNIALPVTFKERSTIDRSTIPEEARFTDQEVVLALAVDVAISLSTCSSIMGISINKGLGIAFAKFHLKKARYGMKLQILAKDKGWIITPPLHMAKKEA